MRNRTEGARLEALRQLDLLDTGSTEAFDRITRMAAQLFSLPIAAVSLTDEDRQWFKSRVGVDHLSIPRAKAPCAQVAENTECLVIPDLLADPFYKDSHLARNGVRFYAGAPLTTHDGFGLGAMCVLGLEPREVSAAEMAMLRDLAAMTMAQVELRHAFGRIDPLSGLPNRTQFVEDLEDLAKDRPRHERRLAVLVDIASPEQLDNAVRVMGSSYLDDMIKEMADAVRAAIGPAQKAYHVATTQFAFLAPSDTEEDSYTLFLAKLLEQARQDANSRFVTTATAGVAPFTLGLVVPRDVLRIAHSAAQDARRSESKVSVYCSDQDEAHRRRFTLLNEFGGALEKQDELRLVYQPRVDLALRRCMGAEALLRWRHPTLGEISPGEFMPLVEHTSMSKAITAWVLGTALKQLVTWRSAGLDLQLSVNVSATNLAEPGFAEWVIQSLSQHSLPPECLELELTESAIMGEEGPALAILEAVAKAGIRLAIDDFGTGYSSLSYLQRLPASVVKIDQSFMRGLTEDERKRSLVSTMISLSHKLGYRVVAEGVETHQTMEFLCGAHCDEAQGYLFGRPMTAEDFITWYRNHADISPESSTTKRVAPHMPLSTSLADSKNV